MRISPLAATSRPSPPMIRALRSSMETGALWRRGGERPGGEQDDGSGGKSSHGV